MMWRPKVSSLQSIAAIGIQADSQPQKFATAVFQTIDTLGFFCRKIFVYICGAQSR